MLTLKEMKSKSELHGLRSDLARHKQPVMLDYQLIEIMTGDEMYHRRKKYDTDVYLEKYKMNLQRPYVWTYPQQNAFIQSILYDKMVSPFVVIWHAVNEDLFDEQIVYVIDGKQRLTTIQKFCHNEFPVEIGDNKYFFKDFDDETKIYFARQIDRFEAIVYYSYASDPITDDEKIKIFNFYNFTGTPQAEEHRIKLQSLLQ